MTLERALGMIEEMGVDRHMEEILRLVDQQQMTDPQFRDFLAERGCPEKEIEVLERGAGNITVYTGPHLGGVNQRISLPELIDFLETASAFLLADRYWKSRTERFTLLPEQQRGSNLQAAQGSQT